MINQEYFNNKLNNLISSKINKVAVALSGGSDSLALTLLSNNWAASNGKEIIALTVDHNLRKGSAKEAKQVQLWMNKRNIPHEILSYKGEIPSSNIEAIAREYRYKLLLDYCKKNKIKYLLIGHNADEQTETFFLNLSRGSGVYGLCGMAEISEMDKVKILRPLLDFTKEEIKAYLKTQKQKWVEDESNKDSKYKRVRIRNIKKLLDNLELSNERIRNTISNMNRVREAINYFQEELLKQATLEKTSDSYLLNIDLLKAYPEEITIRTLSNILKSISKQSYPARMESLSKLYSAIMNDRVSGGITLSLCKISVNKNNNLLIEKESTRIKKITSKK